MNIYAIGIELPQHQLDNTFYCLFKLCNDNKMYWEYVDTYNGKQRAINDIDRMCGVFIKRGHSDKHPFEESHFMDKDSIIGHIRSSS